MLKVRIQGVKGHPVEVSGIFDRDSSEMLKRGQKDHREEHEGHEGIDSW